MKKAKYLLLIFLAIAVIGLVCRDVLIQTYVRLCSDRLEAYAVRLLEGGERKSGRYGPWKTSVYPDEEKVEFSTGGFGLAPAATYKGFYYAGDNTHKPFSAATQISMETDGDRATWTDGTDNHGVSIRLTEKWFWYEASF